MKYGQQLEHESVPEWSLHNLDYDSLKHEIKVHTTRDQAAAATAMAIPGHQDQALRRFEDGLYAELCRQHDRVHLFVTSKADEISRRLEHLDAGIQRWLRRCADGGASVSLRRQRRFAKYERDLLRCGDDIAALTRFANAQVVAFRKILKKYRKWTGSTALGSRFSDSILADPKSFTRRDFSPLQARHDDMLVELRAAAPPFSEPSSPSSAEASERQPLPGPRKPRVTFDALPPAQVKYWNEYDDGSEAGSPEDDYAIYVDPDGADFPGLAYVRGMVAAPYEKARRWLTARRKPGAEGERRPLLSPPQPAGQGCFSSTAPATDSEDGYASSDGFPHCGYAAHYALPSIDEQRVRQYRERMLLRGAVGCFLASFALLAVAAILLSAGKTKLRVEVDAGVTMGAISSLLCACTGLAMTLYRRDAPSLAQRLGVWGAFTASCLCNGILLLLILGSGP